jgi:acetolactate synthase-1/2/3 large subunit
MSARPTRASDEPAPSVARVEGEALNGAQSLVKALLQEGVNVCFGNPGTSEMQFVAALDTIPGMRSVLCLFEGVATGAADGYGRMLDRPAATLLHLGPGLANGLANLHNAKRASTPVVNIVGEHATFHKAADSPLTTDVEAVARPMSDWLRTCASTADLPSDAADAVRAAKALPGRVATLIVPADLCWSSAPAALARQTSPLAPPASKPVQLARAARALGSGRKVVMVLAGRALRAAPLASAARIAAKTGAELLAPYGSARIERGAGRVAIARIPPPVDLGVAAFEDAAHVVLIGAKAPSAMFGYPGKPSLLLPAGCDVIDLADGADDVVHGLRELEDALDASRQGIRLQEREDLPLPSGQLTADGVLQAVAALMPDDAIVVDESVSAGRSFFRFSRGCPPHDFLTLTGGAIGAGIPLATGAAIACPRRKVINLEGDGSAMYTVQGLWTQARERLDVLTIIFANRGYQILRNELRNVGAVGAGEAATRMLDMTDPDIDWVRLARGFAVDAARADTAERLISLMQSALARDGPFLIEARFFS